MTKQTQLNLRISEQEKEQLKKKADRYGFRSVSEYVRVCSLHAEIRGVIDMKELKSN
jgi:hypothetical protein